MYGIKHNIKVKDFDEDTRNFLLDMGLDLEYDVSSSFEEFLNKNNYDLNENHKEDINED